MTTMTKKSAQTEIEFLAESKGDLFKVDFRNISVIPDYNARESYNEIPELAEDILIHGVQVPMMVKRDPSDKTKTKYLLIRGYRRHMACNLLLDQGKLTEGIRVPVILVPKHFSEIDLIVDLEISNSGQPLTILERANIVGRLLNLGLKEGEIAKRLTKSPGYITNCVQLLKVPANIKKMIKDGTIASSLVNDIFRKHKFEDAITKIEYLHLTLTEKGSEKKKITKKDELKAENKYNSFGYVKKIVRISQERTVRQDQIDLYNFVTRLVAGEFSKDQLDEMFFEPSQAEA